MLLYALFRFTRFGLATRAAAENEKGAIVLGFSPDFLAGANWVLATVIVGVFGIIVSPITTLDPISVPLLIVPALGAALLGGFTSFGVTVAAGLGIGMLQVLTVYYSAKNWFPVESLPAAGVAKSLPFIVIVIAMFARGKSLPERGDHRRRTAALRADATPRPDPGRLRRGGHVARPVPPRVRLAAGHHQHVGLRGDRALARPPTPA